jgi:hypothetical protein
MVWPSRILVVMGLLAGVGCSDHVGYSVDDVADDSRGSVTGDTAESSTDDTDDGPDDGSTEDDPEPDPPALVSVAVETTPVYRPVQGAWPAAAFDGTQYLVVWEDQRLRRPILYGGRIAADGTTLHPFGFRILDATPEQLGFTDDDVYNDEYSYEYQPAVVFDGENFLVVMKAGGMIRGVRVSPAGEVLDPAGFLIAAPILASRPSLIFDGEHYQVIWSQSGPGAPGVFKARVKPDATMLDPGGVFVYASDDDYPMPVGVSFDGTNILLSWVNEQFDDAANVEDFWLLWAGRIAVDGTLIDETPIRLSPEGEDVWNPAAGFDGTNHVIAWSSEVSGIRASRVTPDGTLLDPDGFAVDEWAEKEGIHRLDVSAGNGTSSVVWSASHHGDDSPGDWADLIRAAQIATDGTTSLHPIDAFPPGLEATVAAHLDGALLLWGDGRDRSRDYAQIVGMRLDTAGTPVGSVVAPASTASRQDVIAAASDGQNFFVLWTDTRYPTGKGKALHGARVGADGTPLDLKSLPLTETPIESAHAVFDGANFVITWLDPPPEGSYNQFNTVRVSPAGLRLDTPPLHPPLCDDVAGASDGTHTLLVGDDCDGPEYSALLLDQDGAVASDLMPIPDPGHVGVAASFDGTGYLVVGLLQSQRITQAGALEGPPFSVVGSEAYHLETAGGDGQHLVVWATESGIWAARVSSDGQVLDPEGQLVAALNNIGCTHEHEPDLSLCSEASVAFDGENFVVAWREQSIPGHPSSLDLYAVTVSPEGVVSPRFVISQEPEREGSPFLAANAEGQVLAAYNRFVPGPPYDTRRAVATLLP